jgi:flagellar protein FliO/FliZ
LASPFADSAYSDKPVQPAQGEPQALDKVLEKSQAKTDLSQSHNATVVAPDNALSLAPQQYGWAGYFQSVGVIFLLLALIAAALFLLKRFGPRSGMGLFKRGDLKLEGQLPLGPRKSVVVVRFLNKRLVLGVADSQINLLTEVDDKHASSDDFSQTMERAQRLDTPRS